MLPIRAAGKGDIPDALEECEIKEGVVDQLGNHQRGDDPCSPAAVPDRDHAFDSKERAQQRRPFVEQRAKEISVRIALGATTQKIAALVLSQLARPVGFGLLAGAGLAAGLAIVLTSALGSESGNTVRVFDPLAYAASLLVVVIACVLAASVPSLRAARVDPIATLRND